MNDGVRIDKYLWAIRAFKTRTEATDACKGGKVHIGGQDIKPSRNVQCGDVISVRKGAVTFTWRVKELIEKRVGAQLVERYAENLTPEEELMKLKAPVETFFLKRERGSGRPTKRDRRQMDELIDALDFDAPNFNTPDFNTPDFNIPDFNTPDFNVSDFYEDE